MSEPSGGLDLALAEALSALSGLKPLSGTDYNALISVLGQEYSIRGVADLMHALTGRDRRLTYHDVLAVLGGHRSVDPQDADRVRAAACRSGWRPGSGSDAPAPTDRT